jgi:L-ribulose-5-phosphate 3-epimerase
MSRLADEGARSLDGQIAMHRRLGWKEIELRTIDGRPLCELDDEEVEETAGKLQDAGLRCRVAATRIGSWCRPVSESDQADISELQRFAAISPVLGIDALRVMSWPNDGGRGPELSQTEWRGQAIGRLQRIADIAERCGLTLLHENCAGWAGQGPDETLDLLDAVGSERLALLFDPGNCIYYGQDPFDFFNRVRPFIRHVHVKDAIRTPEGVDFVLPGEGAARLRTILGELAGSGYDGILSIEPHLVHRPHEGKTSDDRTLQESYLLFARCAEAIVTSAFAGEACDA